MSAASILDPRNGLLFVLAVVALLYVTLIVRATARGMKAGEDAEPGAGGIATGFITNFFDTLGIGSFATTTTIFRLQLTPAQKRMWSIVFGLIAAVAVVLVGIFAPALIFGRGIWFGLTIAAVLIAALLVLYFGENVDDQRIPGTLNVGHTLPTIAQAFIFTKLVPVDPKTLIALIVAAVLGAWFGAGIVAKWPRRRIQLGMGIALFVFAGFVIMTLASRNPAGGTQLELTGTKLIVGFAGNLMLGALMTLGIGLYAPCMIMIYMLGMNPTAAFPIMMGSCAFLMPVASARFVRERGFELRPSLGLLIGGLPAVLIAALIVKSLDLTVVRWLVLAVVLYTAAGLVRAALKDKGIAAAPSPSRAAGAAVP